MSIEKTDSQEFTPFLFWTCLSLIFLVLFNFSMTNMAARYILGDLGGSNDTAAYGISIFGIGNVLTIPLALTMKNRWGIRVSIHVALIGFLLTSFFCGFSFNYPLFLLMRFLQGATSGPIFILLTALVTSIATEEQRENYFKDVLMSFIIAPTFAASLGGFLAYDFDWRWVFYFDTFCIAIAAMLMSKQLIFSGVDPQAPATDWIGYCLFILSIFPLSMFTIFGQELDWFRSPLSFGLFIFGGGFFVLFIYWVWRHPNPILNLRLLKGYRFCISTIYLAALFSLYFGMVLLISFWLGIYVNYTATWVSVGVGTSFLGALLMVFVIRATHHRKSMFFLLCSILLLLLSCLYTMRFNEYVDFSRIAISRLLAGFGIALFLPPLFHLMLSGLEEEKHLPAITVFQFTRALSSSLGAALYMNLWYHRFYFYYDRLISQLTEFSQETIAYYQKAFHLHFTPEMANVQLLKLVERQSRSLALNDCFYFMAWVLGVLLIYLVLRFSYLGIIELKERFQMRSKT